MSDEGKGARVPVLYREHLLLGASFGDDIVPLAYANDSSESCALAVREGAVLADVSQLGARVFWEGASESLACAAFAGKKLSVGECAFEAVLTGDGALTSVPLLARTGVEEFLVLDGSQRSEVLFGWLDFLRGISQDGFAPYATVRSRDATGSHVVLLLWGARAQEVLADYVETPTNLPGEGRVASVRLDRIPTIILRLPHMGEPCYVVMVPPASAVALWRSFLSFSEVVPVGMSAIEATLTSSLPWYAMLSDTDVLRLPAFVPWLSHILRTESDFVGGRALDSSPGA